MTTHRLLRHRPLTIGCAALALTAGVLGSALASAPSSHAAAKTSHAAAAKHPAVAPVVAGSRYLALGDSVPFGYRESNSIPTPNDAHTKSFVGYPEDVAADLGLTLTNAACPGETTASFISTSAQSNGCENSYDPTTSVGWRDSYPLHVKYAAPTQSQLAFAEKFLTAHPNTRLVTLTLGANDGFICQKEYPDGCVSEIPSVQKTITTNLTTIFKGLRDKAHYTGQIALVTYYSFDYTNLIDNVESMDLNTAAEKAAKPFDVRIADGYAAYQKASAQGRGNPCTAQLLTALSGAAKGTCGVHPSLAGAAVLAQAVDKAIKK